MHTALSLSPFGLKTTLINFFFSLVLHTCPTASSSLQDWSEYDENTDQAVGIYEVESQFIAA